MNVLLVPILLAIYIAAVRALNAATPGPGQTAAAGGDWQDLTQIIVANSTSLEHEDQNAITHQDQEYTNLQSRLNRSSGTWNANHPRYRLLMALYGFSRYKQSNLNEVKRWRDLYQHVSKSQKKTVEKVLGYTKKLNTVQHLFEDNDLLARDVLRVGMEFYGIEQQELDAFVQEIEKEKKNPDRTSVVQGMKHFVRDWSEEGISERGDAFECILQQLEGFERSEEAPLKVLLPGAGAGRLGYEIDALGGFSVTINEWSAYMNLIHRYATQIRTPNSLSYHPYIDWWSHHATTTDMLRAVPFPDWIPPSPNVVMVEGDFTTVLSEPPETGKYDIILTFFFIDTARNLMSYLETIHRLLKKGGTWMNLGPLLYGTGPWLQLSVQEIVALSEESGFEFDLTDGETEKCGAWTPDLQGKVRSLYVPYAQNPKGLSRNAYDAQFWRARKIS